MFEIGVTYLLIILGSGAIFAGTSFYYHYRAVFRPRKSDPS